MSDNEAKAEALLEEAQKNLNSSKSVMGRFFGGKSRQDEALDCYSRAANLFKMAKKWDRAGDTFVTLAKYHMDSGNKHDCATRKADCLIQNTHIEHESETIHCLMKAIDIYTDMGRFNIAAKHHETIAQIYETDLADLENSMKHYEQATDFFKGEESNAAASKCQLKVAAFAAQLENYDRAIQIYEEVAAGALDSSLRKYGAKDYFFRAALCHLCVDPLNAIHALDKYEEQYPAFADSRESKLIRALVQHIEDQDGELFAQETAKFDSVSRLDNWYTTLLLRVKKTIPDGDELC